MGSWCVGPVVPMGSLWVGGIQGGRGHSSILSKWLVKCVTLFVEIRAARLGLLMPEGQEPRLCLLMCSGGRAFDFRCSNAQLGVAAGVGAIEAECSDIPASFRFLCPWVAHRDIGAKLAIAVCPENWEALGEGWQPPSRAQLHICHASMSAVLLGVLPLHCSSTTERSL